MRHPAGLPPHLADVNRSLVMGIVNVTPDSFSDGGLFLDPDRAVAHGLELIRLGADLIDVGGESTRPGAHEVPADVEIDRVLPVVRALAESGVAVSIDTRRARVAQAAVEAGAIMVNDVSGGTADQAMLALLADMAVPVVLMHNPGGGASRDDLAVYDDVVREVVHELRGTLQRAEDAGIDPARIVIDPGLGFAKLPAHNWALLGPAGLAQLASLGRPLLVGASRKRFLATDSDGRPRDNDSPQQREKRCLEVTASAVEAGVWGVRVHDAAQHAGVVRAFTGPVRERSTIGQH